MSLNEKNEPSIHLIDGHNLLHFSPKLKKLYKINPHLSLQELVNSLVNWATKKKAIELVIYLDGKNSTKFILPKHIKLFQSGVDKTADELIISHAQKWAKNKVVVVHTQDRELQKKLRVKGVFTADNKSLAAELFINKKAEKAPKTATNKSEEVQQSNRGASAQEVDEMLLYYHLREMDENDDAKKGPKK